MESIEKEVKDVFDSICWKLNRGNVSNYQASVGLFSAVVAGNNATNQEIVKNVLGSITESNFFETCELERIVLEISKSINWEGDEAVFPNRKYHQTTSYFQDLELANSKLRDLFQGAPELWSFVIEKGHPFYPVFWEFAFLVKTPKKNYVLVGSCSD